MTERLDRLRAWLVEPVGHAPRAAARRTPARPPAPSLAVLASAGDARGIAAAVALRAAGSAVAVVGVWPGRPAGAASADGAPLGFAVPAARRLAASMRSRDLRARAAGRLVTVELSAGEDIAVAEVLRLDAAAGGAPTLLALAGPRGARWDALLASRDVALVHAEAELADLAVTRLGEQGIRAAALPAVPGAFARAAAQAGVALPGALPALPEVAT